MSKIPGHCEWCGHHDIIIDLKSFTITKNRNVVLSAMCNGCKANLALNYELQKMVILKKGLSFNENKEKQKRCN